MGDRRRSGSAARRSLSLTIQCDMVQKWWFKCAAQRFLSHIPLGWRINGLWSRKELQSTFDDYALQQALHQVHLLRRVGFVITDKVALEVGTGWHPIMPYVLRLAGCTKVILCDLHRYMTSNLLHVTIRQLRERAPLIAHELGIELPMVERVLPESTAKEFTTLLQESRFEYRSPYDVRYTDYSDPLFNLV